MSRLVVLLLLVALACTSATLALAVVDLLDALATYECHSPPATRHPLTTIWKSHT